MRDIDILLFCYINKIFILIAFDFYSIDFYCDHFLSIASNAQASKQAPHRMHLDWSMIYLSFGFPVIAPTGQCLAQFPQPMQFSRILYFNKFLHAWLGHSFLSICAAYSSGNFFIVESTGLGAA